MPEEQLGEGHALEVVAARELVEALPGKLTGGFDRAPMLVLDGGDEERGIGSAAEVEGQQLRSQLVELGRVVRDEPVARERLERVLDRVALVGHPDD